MQRALICWCAAGGPIHLKMASLQEKICFKLGTIYLKLSSRRVKG